MEKILIKNKILRIEASDFIKNEMETSIFDFLYIIQKESSNFEVYLWYDIKKISISDINKFKIQYSKEFMELKITINQISDSIKHKLIWYDIVSSIGDSESFLDHYKFRSTYKKLDDIFSCLIQFKIMIKFENQRTGYNKNVKNRNNWLKKVGRQNKN